MTKKTFNIAIHPYELDLSGPVLLGEALAHPGGSRKAIVRMGIFMGLVSLWSVGLMDCALAATVDTLKEPIDELRTEIFGGWMIAVKVIAFAGGLVMALARSSIAPALMGGGVTAGIVFFDKYLSEDSAGALI